MGRHARTIGENASEAMTGRSDVVKKGKQVARVLRVVHMARMYSSRKGKSGSTKPFMTEPSSWSNTDVKEIESLIVKYAKDSFYETSTQFQTPALFLASELEQSFQKTTSEGLTQRI